MWQWNQFAAIENPHKILGITALAGLQLTPYSNLAILCSQLQVNERETLINRLIGDNYWVR